MLLVADSSRKRQKKTRVKPADEFGRFDIGVKDIIGFHGETVTELITDFHNAVNHYLGVCQ